jgi:hypothetical protein
MCFRVIHFGSDTSLNASTDQAAQDLPSVDLVRIRGGEAEAVNVKSRTDNDDVSMRARSFLKMIEKFRKSVRFVSRSEDVF